MTNLLTHNRTSHVGQSSILFLVLLPIFVFADLLKKTKQALARAGVTAKGLPMRFQRRQPRFDHIVLLGIFSLSQ